MEGAEGDISFLSQRDVVADSYTGVKADRSSTFGSPVRFLGLVTGSRQRKSGPELSFGLFRSAFFGL